ncbi:MAG: peptide deformylase [Bacteroidales bacterium]|nr:peptide deformylase [Bacteroidales bacterium]MBP5134503.1 peptide deformylase [Paludibacteraceae bacterium]MBR6309723.1 peptide deformylase [Paludibacteraceae bacterium]MDD6357464.1 peptide deformylase [Bacteroidales bacterium]
MILPITLYGNSVLRKETREIDKDYPNLPSLLENMYETMHNADGVGLAAPQVGLDIRLFVIDLSCLAEDRPEFKDYRRTVINPQITERWGDDVSMEEGCLSLPGIYEKVTRKSKIRIHYYDENWVEHDEEYSGYPARVMQHEYDHLEQHVFIDHLSPLRKQLIKGKLNSIVSGKVRCRYRTK